MPEPDYECLVLEDGRMLEILCSGVSSGVPLVYHAGTPSAAAVMPDLERSARTLGLRVISWSRPGYSSSTRKAGRTVADVVADTLCVLDHLRLDKFVSLGWSGGGPHALACAALAPERCAASATIACVAPYTATGLEWLEGMSQENVAEFGATAQGEVALRAYLEAERTILTDVTGQQIADALRGHVSVVDATALTGQFADAFAAMVRRSLSTGVDGWLDDDLAFVKPWGFDLSEISVPAFLWQGGEDRMVPFAHGEWLVRNVAGATSRLDRGAGHISIVTRPEPILKELIEASGLPA
jgi:pimeloyl-ACP methyl ester carboxylesterase